MVTEATRREDANFVIHENQFTIGDVMAALIFEMSEENVRFFFENRANKHTFVKDIIMREKTGEMTFCSRRTEYRLGVAGRMWQKYGKKITKDTSEPEVVKKLVGEELIHYIDSEEGTYALELSQEITQIPQSLREEWKSNECRGSEVFQESVEFMRPIFKKILTKAGFDVKEQRMKQAV